MKCAVNIKTWTDKKQRDRKIYAMKTVIIRRVEWN